MTITEMNDGKNSIYSRFWRVEVDGLQADLRLFCIIGGTMAISFIDHFGTERFNYCAEGDFPYPLQPDHPTSKFVATPKYFTDGDQTVYDYVRRWYPRRELQHQRHADIGHAVISRRIHDTENGVYGRLKLGDAEGFFPHLPPLHIRNLAPVTGSFEVWWGRVDGNENNLKPFSDTWMTLAKYAHNSPHIHQWLWELPDDVYAEYKTLIAAVRQDIDHTKQEKKS